jgi:hypothetical protein
MGVVTTFDEKRDEAKEYIRKAVVCLQRCLDEDTYGFNDKSAEHLDMLTTMMAELMIMQRKL